ncbi:hypothetical protein GCM10008956_34150 [Deinococcus arenae]|uniref:Lipoprotein n=1 Tax=Deinococcus arenae TaxID=1452751 RepID=A0A8H9GSH7_9DEIO|nr:hypothetical protein [Deinococcus arenae]GGM55425.1 hypothetical protein GCM10008956_34150 [Deinococcus arenae]
MSNITVLLLVGCALLVGCGAAPSVPTETLPAGPAAVSPAAPVAPPAAPVPTPVAPTPTPPIPAAPTEPAGPDLHVLDASLLRVSLQERVLIIETASPGATTFVRLTGCPGPCRLTGPQGVLVPAAGLHVDAREGLTVQARAPLGEWSDAATYR